MLVHNVNIYVTDDYADILGFLSGRAKSDAIIGMFFSLEGPGKHGSSLGSMLIVNGTRRWNWRITFLTVWSGRFRARPGDTFSAVRF